MKALIAIFTALTVLQAPIAFGAEAPHRENSDAPRDGVVTYRLDEQWRVGGLDDEENLFGVITQVLTDDDGNVYLLDQQLSEVAVLSPEGERIATLSREGDGPGESRRPNDMFFLPDGNIGMIQIFPGKIVQIDREGNPAGNFPFQSGDPTAGAGFSVLVRGKSLGGNIVLVGIEQSFSAGMLALLIGPASSGRMIFGPTSWPDSSTQTRSQRFCNSRTLPGQLYSVSIATVSRVNLGRSLPSRAEIRLMWLSPAMAMSAKRR